MKLLQHGQKRKWIDQSPGGLHVFFCAPVRLLLLTVFLICGSLLYTSDEQPFGIDHLIPWTKSRVIGSPDPPLPYTVEKIFTNILLKEAVFAAPEPDSKRLLVVLGGADKEERPARIVTMIDDPTT